MSDFLSGLLGTQPRGLFNFIAEIRNTKSREEEVARVDKELGNIRQKFSNSSTLSSYQKKKYVWKMCYIYMLGYEVDFGHLEFISLLGSGNFTEKSVGYMAVSLLLRPSDDLITLVVNCIHNDLVGNQPGAKCLALAAVANIGGNDLAEALCRDVQSIIERPLDERGYNLNSGADAELGSRTRAAILKKGCLCMLRIFRTNNDCVDLTVWLHQLAQLLEDRDLGVTMSAMSLLLGFASTSPAAFEPLVPYVVSILLNLVINRMCPQDYLYYRIPCPWLQVKCLRFLQYYKEPDDRTLQEQVLEVLMKLLSTTTASESVNKNNADYAVLFEAIALVISYGPEAAAVLRELVHSLLGRFVQVGDANVRYLALDMLSRLALQETAMQMSQYQECVLDALKDGDISVRKRALDLIYLLTEQYNAEVVVGELITVLAASEASIKDVMVVKIAILSERFYPSWRWYIDTMLQVVLVAGDHVAEAVWHRVIQVVLSNRDIHEYAAEKMFCAVQSKYCHPVAVSMASYLLGEIGISICDQRGRSCYEQYAALHQHFGLVDARVQAIILTAFVKLYNLYSSEASLREDLVHVFAKLSTSSDLELQQRACEYLAMPSIGSEVMERVLESMPPFPEDKESPLLELHKLKSHAEHETSDRAAWKISHAEKEAFATANAGDGSSEGGGNSGGINLETSEASSHKPTAFGAPSAGALRGAPSQQMDLLSLDDGPPSRDRDQMDRDIFGASGPSSGRLQPGGGGMDASGAHASLLLDTLGGGGGGGGGGEPVTLPLTDSSVRSELTKRLHNAIVAPAGARALLYESKDVGVWTEARYQAHQGRLTVIVVNNSGSPVSNLDIALPNSAAVPHLRLTAQPLATSFLSPGEEAKLLVAIDCMRPYVDCPDFDVSFTLSGRPHRYALRLPLAPCVFFDPAVCDKATYMQRWNALGPECEVKDVFACFRAVDAAFMNQVRSNLSTGLAQELDASDGNTVTGCCSFRTGTVGADGVAIAVGAMMRLEADMAGGRFRITVRSKNAQVAQALKAAFMQQLEGPKV